MSVYAEAIRLWMSDWADEFDQSWDEEKLAAFLGKQVDLLRPADDEKEREAKTFTFQVVGWSCDHLQDPETGTTVNKWSLLTDEGTQIALYSGSTVSVVESTEV